MLDMKRTYFMLMALIVLVTGVVLVSTYNSNRNSVRETGEDSPRTSVSVRFPIPIYDSVFTPFFVAQHRGYYAEEGLDVSFELGSRELNPVKMVVSGADTIGVLGGPDSVLTARSKGQPVKAVSILHRDADFPGLVTLRDSGITDLAQLDGKRVGFFYGHISTDVIRTMLRRAGITVEEIDVGFDYAPLITGSLDAEWAFRTTAGINLPRQGTEVHFISPAEYGIRTHGYTLFATDATVNEHRDVIEGFLRATFRGIEETLRNPEEAIDVMLSVAPNLDRETELERLRLYNEVTSHSERYPIGYMDEEMFRGTYERLREEGVIERDFNIREAFDLSFLEGIYDARTDH